MIILDTNELSALMRTQPETAIVNWLDQQAVNSIWTTTITLFETLLGLLLSPDGRRRQNLEVAFARLLDSDLKDRVLPLDCAAATHVATLAAERQQAGHLVDIRNTFFAGIASATRATLATRDLRRFESMAMSVINPWET